MGSAAARRQRRLTAALCAAVSLVGCSDGADPEIRATSGFAQGTTYSLQWIGGAAEDEIAVAADRELERIDSLLSNYRPDSTLESFNSTLSTEPFELPAELVELLVLAKRVHAGSDACFDPTVRPLVRLWGFDGERPRVPSDASISAALTRVGFDKLELVDSTHARKRVAELEVDMASIGQGYTAGRLAELLELHGSESYLAEIGGEIVARGTKPAGAVWRVGLENPTGAQRAPALRIPADAPTAVVTSGSYRHYVEADGRRLGHVIDPRTGRPVEHGLLSVTVVGPDAATAAAWGTALLCLGPRSAREAADRAGVAALFWLAVDGREEPELEQSRAFAEDWGSQLD